MQIVERNGDCPCKLWNRPGYLWQPLLDQEMLHTELLETWDEKGLPLEDFSAGGPRLTWVDLGSFQSGGTSRFIYNRKVNIYFIVLFLHIYAIYCYLYSYEFYIVIYTIYWLLMMDYWLLIMNGGFSSMRVPRYGCFFFLEHPNLKWMIAGDSPFLGHRL